MYTWTTITSRFGFGKRASVDAVATLTRAYQAVFNGSPSRDQQEMVLADLLNVTGFQRITPPSHHDDRAVWFNEGRRAVYAHIFAYLRFDLERLSALETAAIEEAANTNDAT